MFGVYFFELISYQNYINFQLNKKIIIKMYRESKLMDGKSVVLTPSLHPLKQNWCFRPLPQTPGQRTIRPCESYKFRFDLRAINTDSVTRTLGKQRVKTACNPNDMYQLTDAISTTKQTTLNIINYNVLCQINLLFVI